MARSFGGLRQCTELAAALPFGMLAPETLVWKLAALMMAASAGTPLRADHAFQVDELPGVFEQLALQLQDFPAPPSRYRPQAQEPELIGAMRIRAITGFSGAGKTAWVAQSALQSTSELAYFDVGDTPGPAVAIPLARELAGRFFESGGGLGQVLLPGTTGLEMLRAIDLRLQSLGLSATVVIDNAPRVPAEDLHSVLQQMAHLHFVLLCQALNASVMMKRRASTAAIATMRQARPAPATPPRPGAAMMLAAAVATAATTTVAYSKVGTPRGVRAIELSQCTDMGAVPRPIGRAARGRHREAPAPACPSTLSAIPPRRNGRQRCRG
jgi:hypothetical protein